MSAASKGRPKSPEHRAALRAANTPEVRAKKSEAQKGRIISDAAKAKMSAARKGVPLSPEHCAALSAAQMGRRVSAETRAKISAALQGHPVSPETCAKMSEKGNPQWLGGISRLPYAWTFNAELKEEVRRRDDYKCQLCGAPQAECKRPLSVHHIDYDKENSDPANLVALCASCHGKTNKSRAHWKGLFRAMMLQRAIEDRTRA